MDCHHYLPNCEGWTQKGAVRTLLSEADSGDLVVNWYRHRLDLVKRFAGDCPAILRI